MYMGTGDCTRHCRDLPCSGRKTEARIGELLPSTTNGNFLFTQQLFVHPQTSEVYGTTCNFYRSKDQGSWESAGRWRWDFLETIHDMAFHKASGTIYAFHHFRHLQICLRDANFLAELTAKPTF